MLQRSRNVLHVTLKKLFQRIRHVLQVTWRRWYNVSGTSGRLLDEYLTTYQERLASYLKKMFQRSRNVLQVTWRSCYHISVTFWKLLEEDVTTYQERLASYLTKMLQCIRNVLQVTCHPRQTCVEQVYNKDVAQMRSENERQLAWAHSTCISLRRIWQYMIYTHIYIHIYIYTYIYIYYVIVFIYYWFFCSSYISSHWYATKGLIPWRSNVIHHAGPLNPPHVPAPCPQVKPSRSAHHVF